MKIFLLPHLNDAFSSISDIRVLPDNVIINSGKQLFKPEWIKGLSYTPVLLVRMEKVAKSLEAQFAERYYQKGAMGISFMATSVNEEIPDPMKYCFDDSLVRGDEWQSVDNLSRQTLNIVQIEGSKVLPEQPNQFLDFPTQMMIAESISYISQYFMLKIGDIIAFPLWEERELIVPEQGVFITDSNEKELLFCGVK